MDAGRSDRSRTPEARFALAAVVLALVASAGAGLAATLHHGRPVEVHRVGATSPLPTVRTDPGLALPHRLTVLTHPDGASLTVSWPNGSVQSGSTPFRETLHGGVVQLSLRMAGHNPFSEQMVLDRNRALQLWLDPAGLLHHELGTFTTGPNPKQVAFTPDEKQIWVTDLGGHGAEVFDAATRRKIADIDLGGKDGVEVIFSSDGSTAYVSQMETASVYEIDTRTFKVRRHLFTKGVWSKVMTLSPDGKTLFVSNWVSNDVSEIELATGKVRRLIPTVKTPRGLYVTPDGRRLYVAGFGAGQIERIDLATGASKILLNTGGAVRHLVADPTRGLLYADDMARDEVFVVDLATEQVRRLASTDHTPNTIDLSPDGRVLYVSNRGRNNPISYGLPGPEWGSVLAIDTATGRPLDAIVGGNQPTGLDVSPDGKTLAYSDFLDDRVSLFAIPPYPVLEAGHGGRYSAHLADIVKSHS